MTKKTTSSEKAINWQIVGRRASIFPRALKWPTTILLAAAILKYFRPHELHMNTSNWQLVLSYISALKWPVVVLVALRMLKPHLPTLVDKFRKISVGSSSLEFDQSVKKDSELQDISDSNPDVAEEKSDESTELEAILTTDEAKKAYIDIYAKIYGTQLEALIRLATYDDGLDIESLKDLYEKHRSLDPNPYPHAMEWMAYAKNNILVLYENETKLFKLTNAGLYFLMYLRDINLLTVEKPY